MPSATATTVTKRSKLQPRELGQFDLFARLAHSSVEMAPVNSTDTPALIAYDVMQSDPIQSSVAMRDVAVGVEILPSKVTPRQGRRKTIKIHVVTESDLPSYSDDEKAIVDRTLEALPQSKAWFTYVDIRQAFTISRATVVRRVKSGVVPGIRFADDRVLEDGSVRRFTRDQVRYLLLAIRRPAR